MKSQRLPFFTLLAILGVASGVVFSRRDIPPPLKPVAATAPEKPAIQFDDASLDPPATRPLDSTLAGISAALEAAGREADIGEKEKRVARLIGDIPSTDLARVAAFLLTGESKDAHDYGSRVARRWAVGDPVSAAEWSYKNLTGKQREKVMKAIVTVWAEVSVDDALAWTQGIPDEDVRNTALIPIAYEAARTEPAKGLEIAVGLPADEARNDLIAHVASEWASKSPQLAADWAKEIPDEDLRERVLSHIATAWAGNDPVAAGTLAVKWLTPGKQQNDAVVSIVQQWAQTSPEQAAAWVTQFPDGALRNTAVQELVKLWFDQDLQQTAHWLNGLPAGETADSAISAYVDKLLPHSPEAAALWTEQIADEELRSRHIAAVGELWMETDSKAASAWIARAALSATNKKRLLGFQENTP